LDIFIHAEKGLWDLVYVKIHTPFFGLLKLFPQKLPRKTGVFLVREANIFDVADHGSVIFDGQPSGFYVDLVHPRLEKPEQPNGVVLSARPNVLNFWPDAIKEHSAEYVHIYGGDEESFIKAMNDALRLHEAGHMYLEKKFPRRNLPKTLKVDRKIKIHPRMETIRLNGNIPQEMVHELYGLGVENMHTQDAKVFAKAGGTEPTYQLANQFLILFILEQVPEADFNQFVKADSRSSIEFDLEKLKTYIIAQNRLDIINKAGKMMCQEAIAILSQSRQAK